MGYRSHYATRADATSFWTNNRYDLETGCWNWTASKNNRGYGVKQYAGKIRLVHRLSANFYLGLPLDSSVNVLHRCDNKACFNPKHLFFGNASVNQKDLVQKGKHYLASRTHCVRGHAFSGPDLRIVKNGDWTQRVCNACRRERGRLKKLGL